MRHLSNMEVGVATHTGRVRSANEDDFLILASQSPIAAKDRGWLLVIADGMGGAAGGAEASRTAVRAAVRPFLESGESEVATPSRAAEWLRAGFEGAEAQVYESSIENPNLRGMGTTLTAVHVRGDHLVLAHVGDTRCVRLRDGELEQWTVDHSAREPDSSLTRCIGGGLQEVEIDISEHEVRDGDRIVLMTDGLWGCVPAKEIQGVLRSETAQAAAMELVRMANRAGGRDNSTILVLHIHHVAVGPTARAVEVDLPVEEVQHAALSFKAGRDLTPSRWPPWLLVCGILLLSLGIAKAAGAFDLWAWLRRDW